jgi:hypothetical protein
MALQQSGDEKMDGVLSPEKVAVIHLAFFRTAGNAGRTAPMAPFSRRRQYRTRTE